jgi:flagellar biogenesis protein FliO
MTPLGRYVLETVVTLFAVSALAWFLLFVARRAGLGKPLGPLSLAGRLVLDARRAIYLVRVGQKTFYVVGASEGGLTKLGELSSESLPAIAETETDAPPHAFKDFLERIARRPKSDDRTGGSGSDAP